MQSQSEEKRLTQALLVNGFSRFIGVPCGVLAPLYEELRQRAGLHTLTREDNALAVAAGMSMAGDKTAVLMQNSGFGQSINVLASLITPYSIPILMIISLRGTGDDRTQENRIMGAATEKILDAMEIPFQRYQNNASEEIAGWARGIVFEKKRAAAITIRPGAFGWQP